MTSAIHNLTYAKGEIDLNDFHNCPEDYRNYVIRIMSMQAYAERLGANEVAYQLRLAPNYKSRKGLARIVSDEATHAYWLYEILESIGISEQEAVDIAEGKKAGSKKTVSLEGTVAVGDEENEWIDLILNNMLMDRAGSYMVGNFAQSSFQPWAEVCEKIYKDEQWHKIFGFNELKNYLRDFGTDGLQEKFSTWYVRALNFFGPPNSKSEQLLRDYGIKRKSNKELRNEFIAEMSKIINDISLNNLLISTISHDYPYHIQSKQK